MSNRSVGAHPDKKLHVLAVFEEIAARARGLSAAQTAVQSGSKGQKFTGGLEPGLEPFVVGAKNAAAAFDTDDLRSARGRRDRPAAWRVGSWLMRAGVCLQLNRGEP